MMRILIIVWNSLVDNDGVFITSCEKAVRENISIAQKDLAIAVAKAILEAYS
jgi:hypothetical protein